jgi:hypothetical protein
LDFAVLLSFRVEALLATRSTCNIARPAGCPCRIGGILRVP